jgi:hypothetical protein
VKKASNDSERSEKGGGGAQSEATSFFSFYTPLWKTETGEQATRSRTRTSLMLSIKAVTILLSTTVLAVLALPVFHRSIA